MINGANSGAIYLSDYEGMCWSVAEHFWATEDLCSDIDGIATGDPDYADCART